MCCEPLWIFVGVLGVFQYLLGEGVGDVAGLLIRAISHLGPRHVGPTI